MDAISRVIEFLGWLQEALYKAYREILDLPWPFWYAAWPFYLATDAVNRIAWAFYDFYFWVNWAEIQISLIDTWQAIWADLLNLLPFLRNLAEWIGSWWQNVYGVVTDWWTATSWTVQSWIAAAIQGIETLINQVEASVVNLVATWDTFWTITWPDMLSELAGVRTAWQDFIAGILPGLATWTGVGNLVESTLRSWFPFYDELAALWGGIQEFFTDPEDWLYKSMDRIIERYW